MRRSLLILSAFLLASHSVFASEPQTQPTTQPNFRDVMLAIADAQPFTDQPAILAWLGLAGTPQPAIESVFARLRTNLEQLRIKRADEFAGIARDEQELQQQAKAAGFFLDPEMIIALRKQHEAVYRDMWTILRDHRRALRAALPPATHARLEALPIHQHLLRRDIEKADLAPEQAEHLEALMNAVGAHLVKSGDHPPHAEVERMEVAALRYCMQEILTPEQRKKCGWSPLPMEQLPPTTRPAGR